MNNPTRSYRDLRTAAVTIILAVATAMIVMPPTASAFPVEGTGGSGETAAVSTGAGDASDGVATSPVEPAETVRIVTETVEVGVSHLAAMGIGVLAFAAAWLSATYVAGRRAHRAAMG